MVLPGAPTRSPASKWCSSDTGRRAGQALIRSLRRQRNLHTLYENENWYCPHGLMLATSAEYFTTSRWKLMLTPIGAGLSANIVGLPSTKLCRIIVRNLPFTFPEKELLTRLREYGPVAAVSLPRRAPASVEHAEHRRYAGYAFVEYFVKADANAAVQRLNGATFHGRVLAVDRAVCRERYQERQRQAADRDAAEDPSRDTSVPKSPGTSMKRMQAHQQGEETRKRPRDSQTIAQGVMETSSDSVGRETPERSAVSPSGSAARLESCQADSRTTCEGSTLSNKRIRRRDHPNDGDKQLEDNEEMRSRTLFVRNLALDATADELKTLLETYGSMTYCVLVRDPLTGLARGSAFVCFAERIAAERIMNQVTSMDAAPLSLEQAPIQLHGRALRFSWALSRAEAALLPQQRLHAAASERNDRRNLYLALEGVIDRNHPAAEGLSEAELALRAKLEQTKRQKLLRNPHNVCV
ncbi:RNA recognition motif-containing protein [Cyanidiococcus yangmingshanensis]|uniref:RNA recognition motif-containing protein n=1 Tax=Cyanidiococcus yangmingshanensis TaxID=2690220 RepID=A0A7J7INH0_9RHOD|nr:RNA recognition motif-containing protein [Cyanidiococcus yangmingshanensis]